MVELQKADAKKLFFDDKCLFTLKGLTNGKVMAKMLKYCFSTKEEYTSGRRLSVERNSRILDAIDTVAEILER